MDPETDATEHARTGVVRSPLVDSVSPSRGELAVPESSQTSATRLTHYLFRYPAKFHPPVVSAIIQRYTAPRDMILDPFVGSGTALVEAMRLGRNSVGVDVDPLAVEVSLAKTRLYDTQAVMSIGQKLIDRVSGFERSEEQYLKLQFRDISERQMKSAIRAEELWTPAIPRLQHWFRRYVIIDLGRIWREVEDLGRTEPAVAPFLRIIFASIIRNSSNADPVPVSGLEYTSHMRRRDEQGRLVNSFALLRSATAKAINAVAAFSEALGDECHEPAVHRGSATRLKDVIAEPVDAVVTSPPYQNAVDYYRRHQLESFWLGHVESQSDREKLIPEYIGRPNIAMKDPIFKIAWAPPPLVAFWEDRMASEAPKRARDFRHYCFSMKSFFESLRSCVRVGAPVVLVVGHSSWRGEEVPTGEILGELAEGFILSEVLSYPIKNRYMSYSRHNKASIDKEYVLVFRRE